MGPLALVGLAAAAAGKGLSAAQQAKVAGTQGKIAEQNAESQAGYRSKALGEIQNVIQQIRGTGTQNEANRNTYLSDYSKALATAAPQMTPAGTTNVHGVGGASSLPNVPGASARYGKQVAASNQTVSDYVSNLMNSMGTIGGTERTAAEQALGAQRAGADIGVLQSQAGVTNLANETAMNDISANPWWKLGAGVLSNLGQSAFTAGITPSFGAGTPFSTAGAGGFTAAGTPIMAGGTDSASYLQKLLSSGGGAVVA